jgi:hypothetical protein
MMTKTRKKSLKPNNLTSQPATKLKEDRAMRPLLLERLAQEDKAIEVALDDL